MNGRWRMAVGMAAMLGVAAAAQAAARTNLVFNGSFDDPKDGLSGWRTDCHLPGESWYAENKDLVSVMTESAGRKGVLRLYVKTDDLAINQGVKADSKPIPIDTGTRYRFSAAARSTGPNCRILIEGYRWRPGIKPHDNPDMADLRKCYKFTQLFFGAQKAGDFGGVGRSWATAEFEFPDAFKSDLQRDIYGSVKFVIVHIVGIGGKAGDLQVDDVTLEPLGPVKKTK
jgi:hypothetical protein